MQVLSSLSEQYGQRIQAQAGPLILAQELKMMDEMLACGQNTRPGRGTLSACGGVFSKLGILHDGTIVPCNVLSTMHMGKIGVDNLQEVWQNHPIITALRQRRDIPLSSLQNCKDCSYKGFCAGGCPGGALYANNDFNTRDPMSCYRILKGEDPYITLSENDSMFVLNTGGYNG